MPSSHAWVSTSWRGFWVAALTSLPWAVPAQIEEIIVTAQRRESRLQETPISIQAFTAEDLRRVGIEQGRDLGIMAPNVVLNSRGIGAAGFGSYYMRGLPGVGVYVDGVWQGDRGLLETSFVEVDRVELLRCPQGTLFGRNTNGGAVNVTTRRPGETRRVRLRATAGEHGRQDATFALDFPVADTVRTKWTAARFSNDGFLNSLSVPRSLGGQDDVLLRGDVLFKPTERVSIRVTMNDEETRTSDPRIVRFTNLEHPRYLAYNILAGNPEFLAAARALDPAFPDPPKRVATDRFTPASHEPRFPGGEVGRWQTKSNTAEDGLAHDIEYATLTLRWQPTERFTIESITAGRDMQRLSSTDRDGSELTITGLDFYTREENLSQEVHFSGRHFDGKVDWLAGLYFFRQDLVDRRHGWLMWEFVIPSEGPGTPDLDLDAVSYVRRYGGLLGIETLAPSYATRNPFPGFTPLAEEASDLLTGSRDEDRAFFGEVTIGATERFDLTLGLRVTAHDGALQSYVPTDGFRPAQEGAPVRGDVFAGVIDAVDEDPDLGTIATHKVAAAYRLRDDLMLYASWSEGFTSSEIVTSRLLPDPIVLDPEIVSTRELGLRSSWLDQRLRFNATYFASRWDGLRVPVLPDDPRNPGQKLPSPVPTSEGLAEAEGWELELAWMPGERWFLSGGLGLLDTAYLDIGNPDPTGVNGIQPHSPFAYAPRRSASLSLGYTLPLGGGGALSFAASYGWMDDYVRAPANQWTPIDAEGRPIFEPAYGVMNARVRFEPLGRRWDLELWGRNLTDAWYVNGGIDARTVWGFDFATVGAAREVGLSVGFEL